MAAKVGNLFGIFIDQKLGQPIVLTICPLMDDDDQQFYGRPVRELRAKTLDQAKIWTEKHFGPVIWTKLDSYTSAARLAWTVIEATLGKIKEA